MTDDLRKLSEEATAGPWRATSYSSIVGCPITAQPDPTRNTRVVAGVHGDRDEATANARFIVAAVNHVRARLAATPAQSEEATALKPCPFCGGVATIEPKNWAGRDYIGVFCTECLIFQDSRSATDAEAIAAWNTRATCNEGLQVAPTVNESLTVPKAAPVKECLTPDTCPTCGALPCDWTAEARDGFARFAALEAENARLRDLVGRFVRWANMKCPCENEQPNPCTLCGASVENLEPCKAADLTLPRDPLERARAALNRSPNDD